MKTRSVLTALILGVIAISAVLLFNDSFDEAKSSQAPKQKRPQVVVAVPATTADVSLGLELTGSVEPFRIAQMASPAEGPVLSIHVREGDRVKQGDMLLDLGRTKGVDAQLSSLRDELKTEEANLKRTRQLVATGSLPIERLDQAGTQLEKVRAQVIKTEEAAQDYSIVAPWDGVVSRLYVTVGEFVAPRVALVELYDPDSLVIIAAVPESHATEVAVNMLVDVRLDAYPETKMNGLITRIYPYLDQRLRTRTVEIGLTDQPQLLPGMFARLTILLKTVDAAVVVPSEAVITTPKGRVVFVVEEGKVFGRSVEIGIEERARVQILTGIQSGDKVVVAGAEKLKTGDPVNVAAGDNQPNKMPAPAPKQDGVAGGNQ